MCHIVSHYFKRLYNTVVDYKSYFTNNVAYRSLAVPSNAPQNVTIVLLSATSAEIHWDPPPFEDQNGIIQFYTLFITEVDTSRVIEQLRTENASAILQQFRPFHVYQFVIAANTIAGLGPFSNPSLFQMPESG